MKEIKAYIRRDEINEVVEKLQAAGAPGVSVIEIHPVGYGYEANRFEPHAARLVDRYRHLAIVVGVWWLARGLRPSRRNRALEILRQRYARGEISREEYESRRRDLAA